MKMSRKAFLLTMGAGMVICGRRAQGKATSPDKRSIPAKSVIPAALTPFDGELRIAREEFRRHLVALAAVPGVTAILVNGGAGQDSALSREERRSLVAEAVDAVGDRTPIIAALRETRDVPDLGGLAKDAAAEGAHALLIMPPANEAEASWEGANKRFREIFAAADLPLTIYQTAYSAETLARLAQFPQVFAVKDGSGDPATFERNLRAVRALGRGVAVWSTHSRWLLADLAIGADGILSGMGSFAADLHVALAEAVGRSDLEAARRVNDRLFPISETFYRPGQNAHTRAKYALTRLRRCAYDHVRPPLKPLDDAERARIDLALRQSGLLLE